MIDHPGVIVADLEKSKKFYPGWSFRTTTAPLSLTPTATTSKRSAASRREHLGATSDILAS